METRSTYGDDEYGRRSASALTSVREWVPLKRISWGAVFAGVLVAVLVQLTLSLLGLGIGLSTLDVTEEANPAAGLGIGSAIWYAVQTLVALFIGGWVAGRLASAPRTFDSIIHGILTWCLVTLLTFYLLTTVVGRIIGGVSSLVGNAFNIVGNAAGAGLVAAAPAIQDQIQNADIDLSQLKTEANELLRQTGKPGLQPEALERKADQAAGQAQSSAGAAAQNPQAANTTFDSAIDQLFGQVRGTAQQVDREAVVNVIVARTGKSRAEAGQIADNWIRTYNQGRQQVQQATQQAKVQAKETADKAADATSTASIAAFFSLLIGAGAAGFGAKKGGDSKDDYNRLDEPIQS
ncbi:hypothetical protein [Tellurirhabdus rosea]|uniref:hypothetical protein n=1 Tax=Tellurirhabdus rosea TaxID=2674997 RepID=UPI002252CFF3|nr:hypothetical protein [Tellurirhabdus rosea]